MLWGEGHKVSCVCLFFPGTAGVEFSTLSGDRLLRLHRVHSLCLSP